MSVLCVRGNQFSHEKLWPKIENLKYETELKLASSGIETMLGSVLGLSHYAINVGRIVRLFLLAKCLL